VAAALGAARVWGVRSEQRPREQLADRAAAGNPLRQFGERTVNCRNGSVVCACLVDTCLARELNPGKFPGLRTWLVSGARRGHPPKCYAAVHACTRGAPSQASGVWRNDGK